MIRQRDPLSLSAVRASHRQRSIAFDEVESAVPRATTKRQAAGERRPIADERCQALNGRRRVTDVSALRPFFGFYGGKWRDSPKHYPPPEHRTIVEPFAGSAGYSLRYASCNVVLYEIDPIIAAVWQYLIRVSASEIRSIPDLPLGGSVEDLRVCEEARWLVGFWLNRGASRPRRSASSWMRQGIRPGSFWGERVRTTIATQVESIRHWKVHNQSYQECRLKKEATWFVDPPYQYAGQHYQFGSDRIDYAHLANWCQVRAGQVIVCENEGADWLPFRHLANVKTTRAKHRSPEVYWLDRFK